jgi:hypothetical protein
MNTLKALGLIVFLFVGVAAVQAAPTIKFEGQISYRECSGNCRAIVWLPKGTIRLWRGSRIKIGSEVYRTTILVVRRGMKLKVNLPVAVKPPVGGARAVFTAFSPRSKVKVTVFKITKPNSEVKNKDEKVITPTPTVPAITPTPTPKASPTPVKERRQRVIGVMPKDVARNQYRVPRYQYASYSQPVNTKEWNWDAPVVQPVYVKQIDSRELDRAEREGRFPSYTFTATVVNEYLRGYPEGFNDREVIKLYCPINDWVPPVIGSGTKYAQISRPQNCNPTLRRAMQRKKEWDDKAKILKEEYPEQVLLVLQEGEEQLLCKFNPKKPDECTEYVQKLKQKQK